jgi:hypothetical protein
MSQEVETPNPELEEAPTGQTFEPGSEDEAINALSQREANQAPETPEDEPQGEANEEPAEGEPEEAEPEEQLAEVEYEGKTYKVPPELEKAFLRQSDYSRKMGEVQAKEKDYTQRIQTAEQLIESAEQFAEVLSEVKGIDAKIKRFEKVDWQQLRQANPAEYAAMSADLQSLRIDREQAVQKAQGLDSQMKAKRDQTVNAQRAEMFKALAKDLPNWGDELGHKITQYALSKGYDAEFLRNVTDPRIVFALDKARKFDAIQDGRANLKGKPHVPPVAKPGPKRPLVNPASDAQARFMKTKSDEDAIAALEARLKR